MNGDRDAPPLAAMARVAIAWLLFLLVVDLGPRMLGRLGFDATAAAYLAFLAAGFAVLVFALLQPPAPWRPVRARLVVLTYVPLLLVWGAVLVGYLRLMHAVGEPVPVQHGLRYLAEASPRDPGFWTIVAVTVVGAPLAEELLFRGYLHALLRRWFSGRVSIAIGAVLFGLLHGLEYALPIGLIGLWFGWLRERTGSLLPSMLGHALHNGTAAALTWSAPRILDWLYPR